jgi:immunoglobulin-binding protein 1
VHQTFHALDLIAQELTILALAPSHPPPNPADLDRDYRERRGERGEAYSDRLDPEKSFTRRNGNSGPILNKAGKPLQPFTLLDSRQALRNGVFRPDHSLPTMTIDEYLAEERRRGGMIEGGGEPPVVEPNEDDLVAADQETIKAREWDEFKEANPRGSGNTINRG